MEDIKVVDISANIDLNIGDRVRLIEVNSMYTSVPYGYDVKIGDTETSFGISISEEKEPTESWQGTHRVSTSTDCGGYIVDDMERLSFDTLRVRLIPR
jgi:hypothetical protein